MCLRIFLFAIIVMSFMFSPIIAQDNNSNYNEFESVKIGSHIWMKNNLNVDHYTNGDLIPEVKNSKAWMYMKTGAWCYYNNSSKTGAKFGKLYNWYAVNDSRGLAPAGWHIPTDEEWTELENHLGGGEVCGGKLKESGILHWLKPNTGATDESGFNGIPGGYRDYEGTFYGLGSYGGWWSSSEGGTVEAWGRGLNHDRANIYRYDYDMANGFSI